MGWSIATASPYGAAVPSDAAEYDLFRTRIANVLRMLRAISGWTREEAAEALDVTAVSLGRWERGDNPPKGYDLGRLYEGYRRWGAQWEWFLRPPEIVPEVNPVRAHLDELERAGAIAADEREARVAARRRQAAQKRAASRRRRPK